jgi:Tfp pilus assembly protein PilF
VLRSFVRLFAHYGETDKAYEILKKKEVTKYDPWLFSANVALATLLGHGSRFYKQGLHLLNSNKFSDASLTELISGLGTIELLDGNRRKSRDLFRKALNAPNDNALAQVEWALSKEHLFDLDLAKYDVERNYEALALDSFNNQDWQNTLQYSEEWFMDMPFAKRPIMMGSHVSSVIIDDQASAEMFCKAGLLAHPGNPQIINNWAYSLALANKVSDAQKLIDSISLNTVEEQSTKVCLTATQGLILFRKKEFEKGRSYYLDAIKEATKIPDISYVQLALLNYAREEILCNSLLVDSIINKVKKLKIDSKAYGIKILYDRILSMYQKYSQSKS